MAATLASTGGGDEGAVVIADAQTAGRGRRGRHLVFAAGRRPLRLGGPRAGDAPASIAERATTLLTLAAGVALAEGDRARRPGFAPISSGRTICSSAGASSPASSPKASRHRRSTVQPSCSATASTSARRRFRRSCATARRRSNPSSGAPSIAPRSAPRRSPRSRARYDDLLDGAVRCYSRRLAPARARQPRRARRRGTTPTGAQAGITAGIDDHGRAARADRADRVGARSSPGK